MSTLVLGGGAGGFGQTGPGYGDLGRVAGGGSTEEDPGGGRCKPSLGAFQNASMHFETPARVLFGRATALRLVGGVGFRVCAFVRIRL